MQTGRYFSWIGLQYLIKLGRRSWWMSLVVWLMAMAPAQANLELRVAIEERVNQVTVGGSTPTVVKNMAGEVVEELPAMGAVRAIASQGTLSLDNLRTNAVWIEPSGDGLVFIGDKWYRGRALLAADSNGVTAVNYVDLEQYLYSVVGGEMPTNWHAEALKAQAVAARTYVLY
ncbi:MAG: sporulation protein, partial [Leptolyngbyaceae cyanobacterium SL_7_1]|nr:sporulation protein [Leptolyngbyaceae cyanobacterium SL_7_1]